jgi:hypothetical protein
MCIISGDYQQNGNSDATAPEDAGDGTPRETEEATGAHAGEEFEVTFETKESLFMNLEGLSTYTIIVVGFVSRPDGSKGQAEASGKIEEDDYLIGVNDVNLEDKSFFDSVTEIQNAEWPMRMKFRRTQACDHLVVRQKGWCLLKEPDASNFHRRYVQLHDADLSYYKPAYGGRQAERHGFVNAAGIICIAAKIDQGAVEKQQFQLTVTVDGKEWKLCVRDEAEQDAWSEALANKEVYAGQGLGMGAECEVKAKEVVVATEDELLQSAEHFGTLKKRSELDSTTYSERFFLLKGAELRYYKSNNANSRVLGKISMNNVLTCTPTKVLNAPPGLEFRIKFVSKHADDEEEKVLVLATGAEATIALWQEKLGKCFTTIGNAEAMQELEAIEEEETATTADDEGDDDDFNDADLDADGTDGRKASALPSFFANAAQKTQGWMYKKGDVSKSTGVRNSTYRRRFFVLQQAELCYYKTRAQSLEGTPTGVIPLRRVTDVNWSMTTWAENGIDLITPRRQFTVVPESEEDAQMWFDALVEAVDIVQDGTDDSALPPDEDAAQEKLQAEIKASLSKSGSLSKLTGNRLTGGTSWKTRFFALSGSVLSYYEKEADLYNEDVDALGSVNMQTVALIKTSNHPEVDWKRAIELKVGERTYVFQAETSEDIAEWMITIAAATGKLEVEQTLDGSWLSKNPNSQLNKQMSTYGAGAKKRATRGSRRTLQKGQKLKKPTSTAAMSNLGE